MTRVGLYLLLLEPLIPHVIAQSSTNAIVHNVGRLELHQSIERELGPGQTDVFTVEVSAGQFLHVEVLKKGVDVIAVLSDRTEREIITADSPNDGFGPAPVSFISDRSGSFQIRVSKSARSSETGNYQIELRDQRPATGEDAKIVEAETSFYAAVKNDRTKDKVRRSQAIDTYQRVASFFEELHRDTEAALCLHRIGIIYSSRSDKEKARANFDRALALERRAGDRAGEARTLKNIGNYYGDLGQKFPALDYYNQALTIETELNNRVGEAGSLSNIANMYFELGERQKALDYYQRALGLEREVSDRENESLTQNNIGLVYWGLGDKPQALDHYNRALTIEMDRKDLPRQAETLGNIGLIYLDLGQRRKALEYFRRTLPLERAVGDKSGEADTWANIGQIYADLGSKQRALEIYKQALTVQRSVSDFGPEASTLTKMGNVYLDLGQKHRALQCQIQALQLARRVSDPYRQALILSNLMSYWQRENAGLAIFFGKEAINTYQDLRRNIQELDPQLQQSYLALVSKDYRRLTDLLIAQGRLGEAEQVLSLLKQQEYFDYIRRDATETTSASGRADLNPSEADLDRHYREIEDQLTAIGVKRGELASLAAKRELTPEESQMLDRFDKDLTVGNITLERFISDLPRNFSASPTSVKDLRQTEGIMQDLKDLPPGTVAIFTLVGDDKFRAILRTPDASKPYEYPIKSRDLNRMVENFRQVIQNPNLDPRPYAQQLYKIIIGAMAKDLRGAKAQTLMFSLDGTLRYLPLAALYDGSEYLVERYRISVVTLASLARLKDKPEPRWKAAGFGVTKSLEGADALPSVRSELDGIIASKPGDAGVLQGEVKLDDQFTQRSMNETLRKGFEVVHIASHFRFQPGDERQSYLLLGDGGHLNLADFRSSSGWLNGVHLLTLSACNTGMGDGAEIEGFGTVAQNKGVKSVIASLWPVADESTSVLMREFYRIRQSSPSITKLEALQEAQLELLHGQGSAQNVEPKRALVHQPASSNQNVQASPFPYDARSPFAHPYYWAPFFLMGNWL